MVRAGTGACPYVGATPRGCPLFLVVAKSLDIANVTLYTARITLNARKIGGLRKVEGDVSHVPVPPSTLQLFLGLLSAFSRPSLSLLSAFSQPSLSLLSALFVLLFAALTPTARAQSVSLAADGTGSTWMLRDNPDGSAALWKSNTTGSIVMASTYGPYAGWTAKAVAVGANNVPRIIWTNTDGRLSLWNTADAQPQNTCLVFGPYAGYTAGALAVGANNLPGILWNYTDGSLSLWSSVTALGTFTHQEYGPYPAWTARSLAAGPNNILRVLWTNTSGQIALWNTSEAQPQNTCLVYGPYIGSTASALAVGANNVPYGLWTNSNGSFSVWSLNPTAANAVSFVGPTPPGYTASALAAGTDNLPRVLWTKADGSAQIWTLSGNSAQIWAYSPVGALTTSVYPLTSPGLTQAQAIARAQTFCAAIGASVTATPTAVFPAPNRYPSQQDTYWAAALAHPVRQPGRGGCGQCDRRDRPLLQLRPVPTVDESQ